MARHSHLQLVPADADPELFAPSMVGINLVIDCDLCAAQRTETCDDCVVSYLIGHEEGTPVILDKDERKAVELLADAGLVPGSRFVPRLGSV